MREFFNSLITEWWGILIIALLSLIVWILLSALLYKPVFKRFYDIILSFFAILIFSPILLILIIIGAIKMGGNPFFTQERPGKKEKIFKLIKFRTMTNKRGEDGELLSDEERLTKYGKFLRATSLDELPELFNIFIGTMSIVGPRPLLVKYLPLYNEEQKKRHNVRPGLTGLAQISGRNAISWEQKFEKDVYYVGNISFFRDIAIILKTVLKVFKRDGINQSSNLTMGAFTGSPQTNKEVDPVKNLIIVGAGGFGRELLCSAEDIIKCGNADFVIKGFLDDGAGSLDGKDISYKILSKIDDYEIQPDDVFVCAVADPKKKERVVERLKQKDAKFYTLIHPTATISPRVKMGQGVILSRGVHIGPDTQIGDFAVLNTGTVIGHDTKVGDYTSMYGYDVIAGNVAIGKGVSIYLNACIPPEIIVGDGAVIGIGSVVIRNVLPNVTVFGNPAKQIF